MNMITMPFRVIVALVLIIIIFSISNYLESDTVEHLT